VATSSYGLRAADTYRAGFDLHKVLATAADTIMKASCHAGPLADRTYPFAASAIAALSRSNSKSCGYFTGGSPADKTYPPRLHLFLTVAHAQTTQDTIFILDLEPDSVHAKIGGHVLKYLGIRTGGQEKLQDNPSRPFDLF